MLLLEPIHHSHTNALLSKLWMKLSESRSEFPFFLLYLWVFRFSHGQNKYVGHFENRVILMPLVSYISLPTKLKKMMNGLFF